MYSSVRNNEKEKKKKEKNLLEILEACKIKVHIFCKKKKFIVLAYLWLNPNFTWHSNVRKYCCAPRRANVIELQEDNGERPCTDTAEDCLLCCVLGCSRG